MSELEQQEQLRLSIESVAEKAAAKAVRDTLVLLGIDVADPIKAQEQFATLRRLASPRTVDNLVFLDRLHTAKERVEDAGWRTLVRVVVTAGLGLLAIMTKDYWVSHVINPFSGK